MKFFKCMHCGNIITKLTDSGVPVVCCGEAMKELTPNTTDATQEKHVPVFTVNGNTVAVTVGSVDHPMSAEHLIEWIVVETFHGFAKKDLHAGDKPHAEFALAPGETLKAVYAYCNLHGLWKKDA